MKWAVALLSLLLVGLRDGPQTQPATQPESVHFTWVDAYIDPHGKPLAAWQFELKAQGPGVTLVGIEGGEHPAYVQPPYYDPKANAQDRIIIGAFNTGDDLPRQRTRVARIMLRVTGEGPARYSASLDVAASSDAMPIRNASVDISEGAAQ